MQGGANMNKNNEVAQRLNELIAELKISMAEFARRMGVSRSTISKIANGTNQLTDQMLFVVCKTFNVNDYWLRDGIGDMFISVPETVIDELAIEYNLNEFWKETLRKFLNMNDDEKDAVETYLKKLFNIK